MRGHGQIHFYTGFRLPSNLFPLVDGQTFHDSNRGWDGLLVNRTSSQPQVRLLIPPHDDLLIPLFSLAAHGRSSVREPLSLSQPSLSSLNNARRAGRQFPYRRTWRLLLRSSDYRNSALWPAR